MLMVLHEIQDVSGPKKSEAKVQSRRNPLFFLNCTHITVAKYAQRGHKWLVVKVETERHQ